MDRFLLDRYVSFITDQTDPDDAFSEQYLTEQAELLKQLKARYQKIIPDLILVSL